MLQTVLLIAYGVYLMLGKPAAVCYLANVIWQM